jgi:pantoate--beta-alanine ligase
MNILQQAEALAHYLKNINPIHTLGFVPTMGALHQGHASLIKKARQDCDIVIVSIFVNPKQFNNAQDLASYPNTFQEDVVLLQSLGVDALFKPDFETMYGNFTPKKYDLGLLEEVMEGSFRPGHFQGVAAAVDRLFDLIPAHKAYFGEKDYQQIAVIKKLVALENHEIDIIEVPTERAESGLALSSRNLLLNHEQLDKAPLIYEALTEVKKQFHKLEIDDLRKLFAQIIEKSRGILQVEYFELADETMLKPIKNKNLQKNVRAFTAVKADNIRLIDNLKIC